MNDQKNYSPGEVLWVFGNDGVLKIDGTFNKQTNIQTVNLEISRGVRSPGHPGVSIDKAHGSVNIQLDVFELVSFAGVLLGHLPEMRVARNSSSIEVRRQHGPNGAASCYFYGKSPSGSVGVPMSSARIFCAAMLCMSRLSLLHPGTPMNTLFECMAGTGLTGREAGQHKSASQDRSPRTPNALESDTSSRSMDIPVPASTDPARTPPRHLRTTSN